ncbi:PREDICTED: putative protein TPRXL [Nicotiana attenuata]|uniref:putative protein TPRXL n=1 Tax=Nicotiana attenuata TaxID=49451 RepID=UPI0009059302|nr:PREDICTED: putative protein TPRXL [Nicotiana attenuata]
MEDKGQVNNDPTSSRGREKASKAKRRVDNNTSSFLPSLEMTMSYPPPHGYTELPQHHKAYTFIQTPGLLSQGHRTILPTYSPGASQPRGSQPSTSQSHGSQASASQLRGSHPYISQPHGSHPSISQSLGSQPSVSQPHGSPLAMSQSQGLQPSSSSTPSISGLRLQKIIIVPEGDGSSRSKCVWEDRYSVEVAANFYHKARKRLADFFSDARKKNKRPG